MIAMVMIGCMLNFLFVKWMNLAKTIYWRPSLLIMYHELAQFYAQT